MSDSTSSTSAVPETNQNELVSHGYNQHPIPPLNFISPIHTVVPKLDPVPKPEPPSSPDVIISSETIRQNYTSNDIINIPEVPVLQSSGNKMNGDSLTARLLSYQPNFTPSSTALPSTFPSVTQQQQIATSNPSDNKIRISTKPSSDLSGMTNINLHSSVTTGSPQLVSDMSLKKSSSIQVPNIHKDQTSSFIEEVIQYKTFFNWIKRGLTCYKKELYDIAFIVFIDCWLRLIYVSFSIAKQFLDDYCQSFLSMHPVLISDMKVITTPQQIELTPSLKTWKLEKHIEVTLSRFSYRMLFNFLLEADHSRLLHIITSKMIFRVVSSSIHSTQSILDCTTDTDSTDEEPDLNSRTHIEGCIKTYPNIPVPFSTIKTSSIQDNQLLSNELISWGLLSGPFNRVERITHQPIPWYFETDDSNSILHSLALINGEVTQPTDPNLALPLCNESPWALSLWENWNEHRTHSVITPSSLKAFPSILSYHLECPISELTTIQLSSLSSGQWLIAGRESGAVALWDIPSLLHGKTVSDTIETDEDDEEFGLADETTISQEIKIRKEHFATPQLLLGHEASVTSLCFVPPAIPPDLSQSPHPNFYEKHCLSTSVDGTVRLWSLEKAVALAIYEGHQAPIWSVDSSPFGNFFLCGSADSMGSLWTFGRRQPLRLFLGHTADVETIKCSPNSILMATGSQDATVKIWDIRVAKQVVNLKYHNTPINCIAFSPNGRLLACTGQHNRCAIVWDISIARPLITFEFPPSAGEMISLAFSYGSHTLAIGCSNGVVLLLIVDTMTNMSNDSDTHIYSTKRDTNRSTLYKAAPLGNQFPCNVAFSPENLLLVCSIPLEDKKQTCFTNAQK